ncbi:hypothetical protein LCGC14_2551060 [marine sediment metagenome]|uniref:Uncharacterized protein n=1 Tax=marine sediment metagenome TaxID=412755 RepID=A0A0F9DFZ0_9ZZZZ
MEHPIKSVWDIRFLSKGKVVLPKMHHYIVCNSHSKYKFLKIEALNDDSRI